MHDSKHTETVRKVCYIHHPAPRDLAGVIRGGAPLVAAISAEMIPMVTFVLCPGPVFRGELVFTQCFGVFYRFGVANHS
ncbi:hypothetical protein C8J48_3506 [Desmospora activa DSM 45169]|uniref:Uncharacterized protein n=1 Tax=Desmospora activa DSM 45169 TaxID=1121389 RepID=A0A2T4Z264_9BACL|nr:hypothetical protein C8J48_3506 [Desmospora activa DSM 45169]